MGFEVFLDTTLGQVLRSLARIEQRRDIGTHSLARCLYLEAKKKANRIDAKQGKELGEIDASVKVEYWQLLSTVDDAFRRVTEMSGCKLLGGVAVFFLPGTDAPVPIYYGTWPIGADLGFTLGYEEMDTRIELVAPLLRHNQIPWYGKDSAADIVSNPLKSHIDHFFLWSMAHTKVLPLSTADSGDYGDCGYNQFTVWANPSARRRSPAQGTAKKTRSEDRPSELADPVFTLSVPVKIPGKVEPVSVPWFCRAVYPPFVGSPVFVNHNSFVLTASFFDPCTWGQLRQDADRFQLMIRQHTLLSQVVVLPLYSFILREATHSLRDALQRRIVSESLLNSLAHRLHTNEEASASIPSAKVFSCADLRSRIYDDLWRRPDSVYGSVLRIQRGMYQRLRQEGERLRAQQPAASVPPLGILTYFWSLDDEEESVVSAESSPPPLSWIDYLPRRSPLTELLLKMETAQRAFRTTHRDHVVHQFQVFLHGLLLLNSFLPAFREAFRSSLRDVEYLSGKLNWVKTDAEIDYLLRLTWFLAATFHDMGYPIQLIDDTVDNLRAQIAKLFNDDDGILLSKQSVSRLLLEPMFHTNPRLEILWGEVIRAFGDNVYPGVLTPEAWRYFLSFMAFHNKDHPFGSVLTLGLSWLDNSDRYKNEPTEWTNDGLHHLLNWHVLFPIMIHHASSWVGVTTKMSKFKKHHLMMAMRIKKQTLEGKPLFSFSKQPMAALLALCDAVQEAGRPSGVPPGEHHADGKGTENVTPKVTDDYRECPYQPDVQCVVLKLRYGNHYPQQDVLTHFDDKRKEISDVYILYADSERFLGKVCVIVHGWDSSDRWISDSGQVKRPSLATSCKGQEHCELCRRKDP